jgi:hypothetical protein
MIGMCVTLCFVQTASSIDFAGINANEWEK